jgi:hypothetical protein
MIKYREGYKYQLAEDYFIETRLLGIQETYATPFAKLEPKGKLTLKQGYAWDGPSGPTIDTDNTLEASLVHDALYQFMAEGFLDEDYYRLPADKLLEDLLKEKGMRWWRRMLWFRAVRIAGHSEKKEIRVTA